MRQGQSTFSLLQQRFMAELSRDKKKAAMLAVLAVVAGVTIGRVLLDRPGPASASAGLTAPVTAADQTQTGANVWQQELLTWSKEQPTAQPAISQAGQRDLFHPDPSVFPQVDSGNQHVGPADSEASQRRAIIAQSKALSLQSTVVSANPTAIINGKVLRVGEVIDGFEVIAITWRTCEIRKDSVTVRLDLTE